MVLSIAALGKRVLDRLPGTRVPGPGRRDLSLAARARTTEWTWVTPAEGPDVAAASGHPPAVRYARSRPAETRRTT